ncbi:MAG: hypothetical protein AABY18_02365 [Candidatus Thermoplasmatota archaeon]
MLVFAGCLQADAPKRPPLSCDGCLPGDWTKVPHFLEDNGFEWFAKLGTLEDGSQLVGAGYSHSSAELPAVGTTPGNPLAVQDGGSEFLIDWSGLTTSFEAGVFPRGSNVPSKHTVVVWGTLENRTEPWFDPSSHPFHEFARTAVGEWFNVTLPLGPPYAMAAYVEVNSTPVAYSSLAFHVYQDVRFTLHDAAQPGQANSLDKVLFEPWGPGGLWVGARIDYDGTWAPGLGDDLSLGLVADGILTECSQDDELPGPARAHEALAQAFPNSLHPNRVELLVGEVEGAECAVPAVPRVDATPVPYVLNAWVSNDWVGNSNRYDDVFDP